MAIWCRPFACWITKATDSHSEYVIFIAFPRQQLLRERASFLCLCVGCIVCVVLDPAVRHKSYCSALCLSMLESRVAKRQYWQLKMTNKEGRELSQSDNCCFFVTNNHPPSCLNSRIEKLRDTRI